MDEEQGRITEAICRLRERVRWRPGKDTQHLAKRIELGQLPVGTTLAEYDAIFIGAISPSTAEVVVYRLEGIESQLGRIESLLMEEQKRKIENLETQMKKLEDTLAI